MAVGRYPLSWIRFRNYALSYGSPYACRKTGARRMALVFWCDSCRRFGWTGVIDVRTRGDAGLRRIASTEYGRGVHGTVGVVCIPRELRPSHCHRDDRHCHGCCRNKLAARSSFLHGVTSPGGCGSVPLMEHRQQSDLQGIACRCHMARFRQRPYGRCSKYLYRHHTGSKLAIIAQHGRNAACRLFFLWHQPGSFRSCAAPYWNS